MILDSTLNRIIYESAKKNGISISEAVKIYEHHCLYIRKHIESCNREEIKIPHFGKFKFNEKYYNKLQTINATETNSGGRQGDANIQPRIEDDKGVQCDN